MTPTTPTRLAARTWLRRSAIACALGLSVGCASPGAELSPSDPAYKDIARRTYYEGMRELVDGDYLKASTLFQAVASSPRHVKHAALAKLRLGDALFMQGRYAEATEIYRGFVQQHNGDPNLPYARFKVAECQFERIPSDWFASPPAHEFDQSLTQQAEAELKGFLTTFPTSIYAPEARRMLREVRAMLLDTELYAADFYAQHGKWQAVAWRLGGAIETYPELATREDLVWRLVSAWQKVGDRGETARALGLYIAKFPNGKHLSAAREQLEVIRKAIESEARPKTPPSETPKPVEPDAPEVPDEAPSEEPDDEETPKLRPPELPNLDPSLDP